MLDTGARIDPRDVRYEIGPTETSLVCFKRMLDSHDHPLVVAAVHLARAQSSGAVNIRQIACFHTGFGRNSLQIDSQQTTIQAARHG